MKTVELSVPSKAFLAGEYLALHKGPALVATVEPRFRLQVALNKGESSPPPFHLDSPAGRLWKQHELLFRQFDFKFMDPHAGQGGWGGSTAEFLCLMGLLQGGVSLWTESSTQMDVRHALESYQQFSSAKGLKPSGADLVAQKTGGLVYFDRGQGKIQAHNWPFDNLEFYLVRTGKKIATHTHLESLTDFDSSGLRQCIDVVDQGLQQTDGDVFAEGIRRYGDELSRLGFVAPTTLSLLQILKKDVLAAKGCGALGADVILLLMRKDDGAEAKLLRRLTAMSCHPVASSKNLSSGLSCQILPDFSREASP